MTRRLAVGALGAFTTLAVCVRLGLLNRLDAIVRESARPHNVWGTTQLRADLVVEGMRPTVMAALLAAFTAAYCIKRQSLRAALFVGAVCLTTGALTLATKALVARPDPHGLIGNEGGSFPSGHVIGVMLAMGIVVMLARPLVGRWIWLIPALVGGLMGASLLLQAAHWSADIVGGGLLATGVLAIASLCWSRWSDIRSAGNQASATPAISTASFAYIGLPDDAGVRLNARIANPSARGCYDPGRRNCSKPAGAQ
jgi:membrane-associated phospholipid phosphatase